MFLHELEQHARSPGGLCTWEDRWCQTSRGRRGDDRRGKSRWEARAPFAGGEELAPRRWRRGRRCRSGSVIQVGHHHHPAQRNPAHPGSLPERPQPVEGCAAVGIAVGGQQAAPGLIWPKRSTTPAAPKSAEVELNMAPRLAAAIISTTVSGRLGIHAATRSPAFTPWTQTGPQRPPPPGIAVGSRSDPGCIRPPAGTGWPPNHRQPPGHPTGSRRR